MYEDLFQSIQNRFVSIREMLSNLNERVVNNRKRLDMMDERLKRLEQNPPQPMTVKDLPANKK